MNRNSETDGRVEIALIGWQSAPVVEALSKQFIVHPVYAEPDPLAALEALGPRIRGAAGHGMAGLSRAHIDRMPNLEICAISGVGLETTDLPRCRERGITVTTATVLFDDVADLAVGLALSVCRQLPKADRYVREGHWEQARMAPGRKLTGMRVGIAGLGRIGIEVARRLEAFKTEIAYADPVPRDVAYRHVDGLEALAGASDILFLCAAGQPKGVGVPLVGRAVFDALGPDGIFINVARGWLVDEPALIEALAEGRLGGAGLDVFYDEPHVPAALTAMDNVVLTPHIASSTGATVRAMGENVVANLVSWFDGAGAVTPVPA
jgi:lactate dehydrogenase-like 2-hydroxyacid dehydrogenase